MFRGEEFSQCCRCEQELTPKRRDPLPQHLSLWTVRLSGRAACRLALRVTQPCLGCRATSSRLCPRADSAPRNERCLSPSLPRTLLPNRAEKGWEKGPLLT